MNITESTLWKPYYQVSSTWQEHASFAFWLIERLRPRVLLELGTQAGFSYCCFCQAVDRLDLDTKAFAVDGWRERFASDPAPLIRLEDHHTRYESFSTLVDAPFDQAASQFDDGSIDLLHLHNAAACAAFRGNVATWSAKLSDRAILLVHGANLLHDGPVIREFWSELKAKYPAFEFSHGHGLGIAKIGASETHVDELFALKTEERRDLQLVFTRAGQFVAEGIRKGDYECLLQDMKRLIQEKQRVIQDQQRLIQRLEERIGEVVRSLREHERQLLDYYDDMTERLNASKAKTETVTRELVSVQRKPISNLRKYLKWRTSKKLKKLGWALSRGFAERMARRELKNAPGSISPR
jgi:hypothetical protein